jgi:hypothetical protein
MVTSSVVSPSKILKKHNVESSCWWTLPEVFLTASQTWQVHSGRQCTFEHFNSFRWRELAKELAKDKPKEIAKKDSLRTAAAPIFVFRDVCVRFCWVDTAFGLSHERLMSGFDMQRAVKGTTIRFRPKAASGPKNSARGTVLPKHALSRLMSCRTWNAGLINSPASVNAKNSSPTPPSGTG